jgi:hypothetical protein
MKSRGFPAGKRFFAGGPSRVQSCCTERSTHTCARVPADLAQAPDEGGKVGGGSGEGFDGFDIRKPRKKNDIGPNQGQKSVQIFGNPWKSGLADR